MKLTVNKVLAPLPRPLPVGMTSFGEMAERIYGLSGGICTLDDVKFVISTNIMRLDPDISWRSDRYFVNIIRNAAAKQISGAVFQDIKLRQQEAAQKARADEEATKLAEAAASPEAAAPSDGKKEA